MEDLEIYKVTNEEKKPSLSEILENSEHWMQQSMPGRLEGFERNVIFKYKTKQRRIKQLSDSFKVGDAFENKRLNRWIISHIDGDRLELVKVMIWRRKELAQENVYNFKEKRIISKKIWAELVLNNWWQKAHPMDDPDAFFMLKNKFYELLR